MKIKINKKLIGDNHPTYLIADIGANHDGDLKRAKKMVYMSHPDKSGMYKEIFIFFGKAFKLIVDMYNFQNE